MRDNENVDVEIQGPVIGILTWLPLASGVSKETADEIERTSVWPVRCTESARASEPQQSVAVWLSTPTEYNVWMRYPRQNGKEPWGVIAERLTETEARVYDGNTTARISIQPRKV